MTIPWLQIVGFGEGNLPPLPPNATIIAPARAIARLRTAGQGGDLIEWRSMKLDAMLAQIMERRGTPTTLLASGDPLWFGFGATLARHLAPAEFAVTPHASSFQYAAARMRWPLQNVVTLSAHARPAEIIHPHITPANRILALTTDATTAPHVATLLADRGYGRSVLTVLENLGGPDERHHTAEARAFDLTIGDFYVLAIECVADPGAPLLPPVPGLPDDIFVTDGQLTKREVRAATIARLAPYPGALLWDVGAGCGSIAIEWMRAARQAQAIAFEREGERLQMIAVNADRLGVPHLRIENGDAPDSLIGMPVPDAVFLGGAVASEPLFHACWTALRPGGRFVANAVTLDGEQALFERHARLGGDLVRIDIAALDTVGGHRALRPRLPVTQWAATKP
jgi:precorrin-6Y C5,15-methyltransferase (decarboxylating)